MANISGIFNSSYFTNVAANVKPSFAQAMSYLMPNGSAPLFAMSGYLPKASAINYEHSYWQKAMLFQSLTTTAAYVAGDTTLAVTATAGIVPGMMFRNPTTGEHVIVNTVTSSTGLTVSRGIGSVAAGAIASGASLYFVGNAYEEGSNRPEAVSWQEVKVSNVTQIFRNAWAVTGTAATIQKFVGSDTVQENKVDCSKEHAKAIEFALLFGQYYTGTRNGKPFRLMRGFEDTCRTNSRIEAAGSTTTYDQLESMLDPVFDYNTDEAMGSKRLILCGSQAHRVINNIGRLSGQINLTPGTNKSFGMQFNSFLTSRGEFTMVSHPMLNAQDWTKKMAFVIDLSAVRTPYLGGRDTIYEEYALKNGTVSRVGDSGVDASGGSYLSELTFELRNPLSCKVITNLTAAAV